MKIEVLFLFLVPGSYYCNADFCREATSSTWYDHALIGHAIKSLLTRGIFACAHKCLSLSGCTSYNYETSAPQDYGVCELNGGSRSDYPNITKKHGFAFAQVRKTIKSCLEAWENGARASGFYCIQGNDGLFHKLYCDLASEPGWAWTLVMSQTLGNRDEQFAQKGFLVDSPRNAEIPNWEAYRLPLNRMKELRSHSTHWRVTCSFPSFGVDHRDYTRAEFKQFDLLAFDANRRCKLVEYMDIRGHACQQCTATWGQDKNDFLTHRSDVNGCTRGETPNHVKAEQAFGRYKKGRNPKFRCTSGDSAVTSFWFGSRLKS